METVDIMFKHSHLVFQTLKVRPAMPAEIAADFARGAWAPVAARIITREGDQYTWTRDGDLHIRRADGSIERFWAKPTLADAVRTRSSDGDFFQFHSNGDVTARGWGKRCYFWSGAQPQERPTVEGQRIYGRYIQDEWDGNCSCDGCAVDTFYFANDAGYYDDDCSEDSYSTWCD